MKQDTFDIHNLHKSLHIDVIVNSAAENADLIRAITDQAHDYIPPGMKTTDISVMREFLIEPADPAEDEAMSHEELVALEAQGLALVTLLDLLVLLGFDNGYGVINGEGETSTFYLWSTDKLVTLVAHYPF